jgi:hypothetical protein
MLYFASCKERRWGSLLGVATGYETIEGTGFDSRQEQEVHHPFFAVSRPTLGPIQWILGGGGVETISS